MAKVIELRKRQQTRAAQLGPAVAPEEITYLEFHGNEVKQIRFASGSLRAKLFNDLEQFIAAQTPQGQILKFLRDKADIHIEFLLWLVAWMNYFDGKAINQPAVEEVLLSLRFNPAKSINELARIEEALWEQHAIKRRLKKQGARNIGDIKNSCRKSFGATKPFRAAVFERLWRLMLVILAAYRQSVAPQRPSPWQRGRLFFLRIFAPTKWARAVET